jgi:hypothetical protein
MTAEYFVNINRVANADKLPFIIRVIDELYPVWGSIILGTLLGLVISIFPIKELTYLKRLLRAIVLGILFCNILFACFYGYIIYVNGFKELKITKLK